MAYLAINGKLLKVDGKYVTVSESSGASGEPQSKTVKPSHETQTITADSGYYLSSVTVEAINLQVKRGIVPTKSTQAIVYESPYHGMSTVYVEPIPDEYIIPSGTVEITENGEFTVKAYDTVDVNVPTVAPYHLDNTDSIYQITDIQLSRFNPISPAPKVGDYAINTHGYLYKVIKIDSESGDYSLELVDSSDRFYPELQSKTVTPTKSLQVAAPDSGYGGLSEVTINAIPDEYIIPSGMVRYTVNGRFDVTNYSEVDIVVPTLDTSDATATPEDIASGKTAYVNGEKITGTATGSSSGSGATLSFDVATATLTITEG